MLDSSEKYFVGEIIRESLVNPNVLDAFETYRVSSRTATVESFEPSLWHIERYRMSFEQVRRLIPQLENNIDRNQWYIHFYSERTNEMFVILSGKTFQLPKYKDPSWNTMIEYGERLGVGRRWTESIPVDFVDSSL